MKETEKAEVVTAAQIAGDTGGADFWGEFEATLAPYERAPDVVTIEPRKINK